MTACAVDEIAVLKGRQAPLRVARTSGHATVGDPSALRALLTDGVGRARAYGCGLLQVYPA